MYQFWQFAWVSCDHFAAIGQHKFLRAKRKDLVFHCLCLDILCSLSRPTKAGVNSVDGDRKREYGEEAFQLMAAINVSLYSPWLLVHLLVLSFAPDYMQFPGFSWRLIPHWIGISVQSHLSNPCSSLSLFEVVSTYRLV